MRKLKKYLQISVFNNHDPVLQAQTPILNIGDLPQGFKKNMELLKITAAHHRLVSLSANQIRMQHRVFTILKEPLIKCGIWKGYQSKPEDYQLIANPQRINELGIKFKDFEECPSLPGMRFAVWNPIRQKFKFQKIILQKQEIKFQKIQRTLRGFNARLWDHQLRHLDGILTVGENISHGQIFVSQQYRDNPGMHQQVQLTKKQLSLMSKESLKYFFQKGKQQNRKKDDKKLSVDDIPDKITKQMKKNFSSQYNRIKKKIAEQQALQKKELKK